MVKQETTKNYHNKTRKVAKNVEKSENNQYNEYDVFMDDYGISEAEISYVTTETPRQNHKNFW